MECRLQTSAVLARVCGCSQNFAAVEEVLSAKALKPESYLPEKVGSGSRLELSEAPATGDSLGPPHRQRSHTCAKVEDAVCRVKRQLVDQLDTCRVSPMPTTARSRADAE